MGNDSSKMAEEIAQQDMKRMAEEIAQLRMEMMAVREALRPMKRLDDFIGPDIDPVGDHDDLMAVREAQLRMERMAERKAQFCMKRLEDFSSSVKKHVVPNDKDLVKSPDDLMAVRRAWLHMLRRHSCPCVEFYGPFHLMPDDLIGPDIDPVGDHDDLWVDFDSDVSAVKDFNKLLDDLMAVRRARLRMLRRALFCPCDLSHTPPHLRLGDFSSSEKKLVVSAVEKWIKPLDDQMAVRRAQLCMKRWVDFGSDVSAVKDFNKLLDDLMAVRRAWLRMERRARCYHFGPCPCDDFHGPFHPRRPPFCHFGPCPWDDFHGPFLPRMAEREAQLRRERWWEIPSSVKKLVVSAVDDWINSLDDQFTRSKKSSYADVSMRSDPTIPIRCHSLPRLEFIESSDFGVPFGINRYSSLPRLEDFGSDVSAGEVLKKLLDDLRAERRPQLRMERRATGSLESSDSDVSLKSDRSKEDVTNFKDRVSPRMAEEIAQLRKEIRPLVDLQTSHARMAVRRAQLCMKRWVDFGSDVSAVKDFNKLLDDLMAVRRAQLRMEKWREIPSSVKKLVVSAVDDWINSLDDQFTRMATRSKKSNYADVSMRSDPTIPIRCHSLPRLESIESSDFGVPFGINRYSSLPRLLDFGSDVSAGEVLKKISDDLMAVRRAQLRMEKRAEEIAQLRKERPDFSSSEKKHVVADDEGLVESPDDLGGDEPGAVV